MTNLFTSMTDKPLENKIKKTYRYDIDGLKAIAIIAVVLYHLSDLLKAANISTIRWFDGGFLGVDIFLVISGFLITGSIVTKLEKNEFSLREFYSRRLFRILPPLLFMVIVTIAIGYFLLFPDVFLELITEAANALIFIGNFRFANAGGYFSLDSSDKLLLHTWYLSLTIQFYLLCPILLMLIKRIAKNRFRFGVFILFVITLVLAFVSCKNEKAYLLTQCRIWELFLGSTLYCYKDSLKEKLLLNKDSFIKTAELIGIAGCILSVVFVRLDNGVYTVYTSLTTVLSASIVIISANSHSFLQLKPISIIGRSSYSLYLWHWPVFIYALRCGLFENLIRSAVAVAITCLCTYLSYSFTEKKTYRVRSIIILYILCALSYGYFKNNKGENYLSEFEVKQLTEVELEKDFTPSVVKTENDKFIFHYGYQKETPHIFLVGDSNAGHYNYYLKNINKVPVYYMAVPAAMAYGKEFTSMTKPFFITHQDRVDFYSLYKKGLAMLSDGDKVILAGRWDIQYDLYCAEKNVSRSDEVFHAYIDLVINDLKEQIMLYPKLKFYIVGLAMVTDKVHLNWSSLNLEKSVLSRFIDVEKYHVSKDFNKENNNYVNQKLIELSDKFDNVFFIDRNIPVDKGNGLYSVFENGAPLFLDGTHYTKAGGCVIGKFIMDYVANAD